MMNNNNDNKGIKFTGDPVAFDGVEGKRDAKTGKGRFDLIPTEVYYPLFSKADHDWLLDCHPASILMSIADEKFIEAIIKMTIYSYAEHNKDYAASSSEFWLGVWPMLQDLAIHFQKGAEHYGERNCQKGIPLWSFKDSAMRHATQAFEGKTDEPHKISVIWNCWLAAWTVITSDKKDATNESDKTSVDMAFKILRDRRKNAKKELFNTPSDSPKFKEKNNDIDEMKKIIDELVHLSSELKIPVVTAQQSSYTREEVEAIKKEAVDKAIKDFLRDRSHENVDRIIKEIGSGAIVDRLKTIPLSERRLFDKQLVDLLSTPEGKERVRWFYDPDDLFKDLIDRVENERGFGRDYRDYLTLLIKLNTVYGEYLQEKKDSNVHKPAQVDEIKRCEDDSERTVDTVEIQRIIRQLKEELRKAHDIFTDTDGKYVQVFFNHLRPVMNDMLAMWNSIAPMLLKDKTSEQ